MVHTTGLDDSLYYATIPLHGEIHVGHIGPLTWGAGREKGYLVLTSLRIIFVRAPSIGKRTFDPRWELRLEQITKLSVHTGVLSTVFAINDNTLTVIHIGNAVTPSVVTGYRDLVATTRSSRLDLLRTNAEQIAAARRAAASVPTKPVSSPAPAVHREREIITQIVKVPCKYCGALVSVTDIKCPACSAPFSR